MKKSLLALAVLGAFAATGAQAQTNVTIGGIVQANFKDYNVGNSARVTQRELRVDDDYNSRFWLTGSEDLGGGMSAVFYVENRLNVDMGSGGTGNGLTAGDSWVGLKGSWGQVTMGRHSWLAVQGLLTEFVGANGATASMPTSMLGTFSILNYTPAGALDITRRNNSITYRSPVMSGFSGTVGFSTASAATEGVINGTSFYNDGREYYLQGNYANGPLWLNLAYRNFEATGRTGTDSKQWRASGYYKFANAIKVGLQYDHVNNTAVAAGVSGAGASRSAWELPLSYTFGNNAILFSYTRAGDYGTTAVSNGVKMWTLGWDYSLSKRTNVGVYYSKLSNDTAGTYNPFLAGTSFTGSALIAGESASTFALGIKHAF